MIPKKWPCQFKTWKIIQKNTKKKKVKAKKDNQALMNNGPLLYKEIQKAKISEKINDLGQF